MVGGVGVGWVDAGVGDVEYDLVGVVGRHLVDGQPKLGFGQWFGDFVGSGEYGVGVAWCDGDVCDNIGFAAGDADGVGDPTGCGGDAVVDGGCVGLVGAVGVGWVDGGVGVVEYDLGCVVECRVVDGVAVVGDWRWVGDFVGSGEYGVVVAVGHGDVCDDVGLAAGDAYGVGDPTGCGGGGAVVDAESVELVGTVGVGGVDPGVGDVEHVVVGVVGRHMGDGQPGLGFW